MEPINLNSYTLLLVDDDPVVEEHLGEFLRGHFKEVYSAKNALEGFDIFEDKKPDVVVTDIEMEKMNGIELARAIKSIEPSTVVIMVTGFNDDEYRNAANEIMVDDYIMKPLNFQTLLDSIKNAFRVSRFNSLTNDYTKYLLDSSKDALLEVTNDEITHINGAFLEIFGLKNIQDFFQKYNSFGELFCKDSGEPFEERAKFNFLKLMIDEAHDIVPVYIKIDGRVEKFKLEKVKFFDGVKVLFKLEKRE